MKFLLGLLTTTFLLIQQTQAQPFLHSFGEWRSYNDAWLAVCPVKLQEEKAEFGAYYTHCWAVAGSKEVNEINYPVYSIRFYQDKRNGAQTFGFTHAPQNNDNFDLKAPFIIKVDGKKIATLSPSENMEQRYNVANEYFPKEAKLEKEIITHLKNGANLTIDLGLIVEGQKIRKQISFWLKGVRASEKFMTNYANK